MTASAAGFFARMKSDPNAIWMREMRQSSRLGRTPWVLFALTLSISLLMCSIGGLAAAEHVTPAKLGGALFQVFFSIAYLVVVLVGPAVAANSIASEREGRTWEAVLLTGLTHQEVARGKFMAAYTTVALYIVVLAPVGALSFLFGGVTATEVVVAFVFLFLVAALAIAFGLAVSSLMSSLRGALVITLMLAICVGPLLYVVFGFGGSFVIHKEWNEIPEGLPIWLPLAYSRATFGLEYVLLLVVLPLFLVVIPAWFLYEATISNLCGESDDRSTGLRRWFAVCTPLLAGGLAVPSIVSDSSSDKAGWAICGLIAFGAHVWFSTMLFAFEPPGPSRRVRVHWTRFSAGAIRRFFGPGLMKASVLLSVLGMLGLAAITMVDLFSLNLTFGTHRKALEIFLVAVYAIPFLLFVVGFAAWLRARGHSPWIARLIHGGVMFLVAAAPWAVAAIGGVLSHAHDAEWIAVAAPSPLYVFAMTSSIDGDSPLIIPVGVVCAIGWGLLGFVLLAAAAIRCRRTVRQHDALVAQAESALSDEDARRAAALEPAQPDAPQAAAAS
jgi:ABC-type transport system involved in multi-copper enzyme maturation permease subunit